MSLPIVAVVGRPNVGKSTFVNRIAQTADAIVHEARGVTRDRSYHRAEWNGRDFMLIDTGGIENTKDDPFAESITAQALTATTEADIIIVLVDSTTGMTTADEEVARRLKRASAPVFLVVNKMDTPNRDDEIHEFWGLGLGQPWPVSATHGHGTGDLLDEIVNVLPAPEPVIETDAIDVAIIGKPNAGKSSLLNRLVGTDRAIVSEVAGTTRDALDVLVEREGARTDSSTPRASGARRASMPMSSTTASSARCGRSTTPSSHYSSSTRQKVSPTRTSVSRVSRPSAAAR